jgi:hypothetical protein
MTVFKVTNVPYDQIVFGKLKKGIDTYMMPTYVKDVESIPQKLLVQANNMCFDTGEFGRDYVDVHSNDDGLHEMIKTMEAHVLNELKMNREAWFGKQDIDDVFLESGMTSTALKNSKFRFRVMDDVQIYDANRESKELSAITSAQPCHLILQMVGIWFTPSRWGVTWKVMQIKLKHQRQLKKLRDCMFSNDDQDDDHDEDLNVLKVPPIV